ncbi:MAG TPA: hypothetical protein VNS32_10455, partial [Flavisolibacter sp.]|nr:hypothetical protein [Flavisolibacter sp.]
STNLIIGPSIGLAVKDNSVVGVKLQYGHTFNSNTATTTSSDKNYSYLTGIYFRRYMILGKGFYLFGEADANYSTSKKSYTYPTNENKDVTQQGGISLSPGIAYTVSKRMHLEISMNDLFNIGFTHINYESTYSGIVTESKMDSFGANTNFNTGSALSVGFRFAIGK